MVSILDTLSQELIDEIIDVGVAMEDSICDDMWLLKWAFLSNCALVCRSFLSRSQQHLFSQIHLGGIYGDKRKRERSFRRLYEILKQSPHIGGYVQEVHLKLRHDDSAWVTKDSTFLSIMKKIKRSKGSLQKLVLLSNNNRLPLCNPTAFVTHFSTRFISPFITSLTIQGVCNVPTAIFGTCVNLIHLKLHRCDFEFPLTHSPHPGTVPRPQIKTLEYSNSHSAISKLLDRENHVPPISLSSLRVLKLGTAKPPDIACLQAILDASRGSLEALVLFKETDVFGDLCSEHIPMDGYINLSESTSLKVLTFGVFLGQPGTDHLSGIWGALRTLPTENCVHKILLIICVDFLGIARTGPQGCFNANWEAFDRQINRVANGKPLNLILRMYRSTPLRYWSSDSDQACEAALERLVNERLKRAKNCPHISITLDSMVLAYYTR